MHSVQHSGEPGFVWTDDLDILFNPCVEVGMYGYTADGCSGFQMCNLTEINGGASTSSDIFYAQCKAASILGTLQAGYTTFDYLDAATREIVEREALIGVGITGWMNNPDTLFNIDNQRKGAETVKHWNKVTAALIGINQAARTTVVKPSGNASVLLQCASGIHGDHAPRYIRHVQMNKQTEVAKLIATTNPHMVETSVWSSLDYVIAFPIEPKPGSIYKSDLLGTKQLDYVKLAQENWIEYGTNYDLCVKPFLRHNVSNTITVDNWDDVTRYIYDNRHSLCGVSLLSAAGDKAYPQAPFTEVLTQAQIVDTYGDVSMFASGLIERGLKAFNNDLWTACSTALGFGEKLTDSHKDAEKNEFVKSFKKFAYNFLGNDLSDDDHYEYNGLKNIIKSLNRVIADRENKISSLLTSMEILEVTDTDELGRTIKERISQFEKTIEDTKQSVQEVQEEILKTKVYIAKANSRNKCADCLKDVYNLHKWWKITCAASDIDWATQLPPKEFTAVDTLAAAGCSGGACELAF